VCPRRLSATACGSASAGLPQKPVAIVATVGLAVAVYPICYGGNSVCELGAGYCPLKENAEQLRALEIFRDALIKASQI
jgi:hypothetical protein